MHYRIAGKGSGKLLWVVSRERHKKKIECKYFYVAFLPTLLAMLACMLVCMYCKSFLKLFSFNIAGECSAINGCRTGDSTNTWPLDSFDAFETGFALFPHELVVVT